MAKVACEKLMQAKGDGAAICRGPSVGGAATVGQGCSANLTKNCSFVPWFLPEVLASPSCLHPIKVSSLSW